MYSILLAPITKTLFFVALPRSKRTIAKKKSGEESVQALGAAPEAAQVLGLSMSRCVSGRSTPAFIQACAPTALLLNRAASCEYSVSPQGLLT
eukprot:6201270-Amphidinium_carterae.1